MKKTKLFKVLSAIIILVVAVVTLTVTMFNTEENNLISVQQEALKHLAEEKGNYSENKIVLQNTNKARAQELALSIGAELRTSKNGEFATLTLPEGVSIEDVYKNDNNRKYIKEMSLDYKVYLAEETSTEEEDSTLEEYEEEILHGPNYQVEDKYYNMQTYLNYLNMQDVWNQTQGAYSDGEKVKVAVIDTGIDTDHPEFFDAEGNSIISTKSYDATNDKVVDMYDMSVIEDENGHGTAVAGVIAAQFNGEGIVGIAPNVELLVIKCEYDEYTESFKYASDIVYGIYYAIEQDVDVINMSLGGKGNFTASAIQLAVDSDIICVAAAGNDATENKYYPAADPNTIGVGALDKDSWELAGYSNFGPNSDVVAPGTTFTSTIGGNYGYKQGTSLATPIVSAVVALYISQNKYVTFDKVKAEMTAAGKDLGELGNDDYYGYGCIDVNAFIFEDKGVITWDYCTEELENEDQVFVRQHTIQSVPDPERDKVVFDDWYFDKAYTRPFNYDEYYTTKFVDDITLYAKWSNEDDEDSTAFVYTVLEDETAEIISYKGKRRNLVIPDSLDGYVVSSIGDRAFAYNNRLKSVTLPKGLKYIKQSAFIECYNLIEVEFTGNGLLEIQESTFANCTKLRKIEILDSVLIIGDEAFKNCSSLSRIYINEISNLESIGDFAFQNTKITSFYIPQNANFDGTIVAGCENVRSVTIHPNNTNYVIEDNAVYNSDKTSIVYYPSALSGDYIVLDGVLSIEQYAFNCSNINSCYMSDNVLKIGPSAFANSSINSIELSESLTNISAGCFSNTNLQEVYIPLLVENIMDGAFKNCKLLERIIFSENSVLKSIGGCVHCGAFSGCIKLDEIDLPDSLISIGENAFFNCSSISKIFIPKNVEKIDSKAFGYCFGLQTVVFEEGCLVSTISASCFEGCISLTSVTFSDNIADIAKSAFFNCVSLTTLEFTENSNLTNVGPYAFYNNMSLKSMQLPSSVVSIDDFAYTFSGLTSVNIPSNLTNLGKGVFGGCYALIKMIVEDGNTSYTAVDNCLFNFDVTEVYCVPSSRVGSYTLPETVKIVGQYSFYYDIFLTNVTLSSGLEDIQENAFYNCWLLQGIYIPAGVFNIGRNAFYECRSLKHVNFAEDSVLERLGYGTFTYCTSLESIRIPSSITSMAQYVFDGCYNLKSITFAENSKLEYIAAYMFAGCYNLEEIIFEKGSSLNSLQAHALDGLYNLKTLDFGAAAITNIDNYALYNLSSLEEFIIPSTVEYIGRYAFYNNQKIERLDIPVTVEYIGESAFNTRTNNIRIFFVSETLPEYVQTGWDNGIAGYYLNAKDYVVTDVWEYVVTYSDTIETVSYAGGESTLNVDTIDGLTVSKIGAKTFYNNDVLTSVLLSNSIVEIDGYSFYDCDNLSELIIPNGVTRIGKYAFAESNINVNLTSTTSLKTIDEYAFSYNTTEVIDLPDSVETIGNYAFSNSSLTTLNINETSNLSSIGNNAFVGTKLESIYLPSSLTNVGNNAFKGVTTLTNVEFASGEDKLKLGHSAFNNIGISEITIPANVYYIGEYTFGSNQNLINIYVDSANTSYSSVDGMLCNITGTTLIQYPTGRSGSIVVPAQFTVITYAAFKDATKITEVSFEEGSTVRTIGWEVFSGCSSLTKITIPDSVISFDYYSFKNCTSLTDVILGENISLIGVYEGAFYNCTALKNITLPISVIDIGDYAFYNCKSLERIPTKENSKLKYIGAYAFYGVIKLSEIPHYASLISIGDYAFGLTAVIEYILPASVNEISSYAFDNAEQFENIYCEEESETFVSIDGILVNKGGSLSSNEEIVLWPTAKEYIVGKGKTKITSIDTQILQEKSINNVIISNSIKEVGAWTFAYLKIKNIAFEENSVCEILGDYSFYNSSLVEVYLPDTISKIGICSFYGNNITSITIPENVLSIEDRAFAYCDDLEEIYYKVSSLEYCNDIFVGSGHNSSGINVVFGKNVKVVPERLFYTPFDLCPNIISITFEEGSICDSIKDYAFYFSETLNKIEIPENIKNISRTAFYNCVNIEEIEFNVINYEIPEERYYIFENVGIASDGVVVTVGNRVTKISSSLFGYRYTNESCANVKKVIFEDGSVCENIGEDAFYNCTNMTDINLPEGLKAIGHSAFYSSGIISIVLPENLTDIGNYAFSNCIKLEEIHFNCVNLNDLDYTNYAFENVGADTDGVFVVFGTNVKTIPSCLFNSNCNIKTVCFDALSICESIGNSAFERCISLESVELTNSIKSIGSSSFAYCENLINITLSNKLEYIKKSAFAYCEKLEEVFLPESLLEIEATAFALTSLKKIDIPQGITIINSSTFSGCSSLNEILIPESVKIIDIYAFYGTGLINLVLPKSVCSIGENSFSECHQLESITISENVEQIGANAFDNCINLKTIYYSAINVGDFSINDTPFSNSGSNSEGIKIVIGENVTRIPSNMFAESHLEQENTAKVVELDFADNSKCEYIGENSFYKCNNLLILEIGENIKEIGKDAFYGCKKVEKIFFNAVQMNDLSVNIFSYIGQDGPGTIMKVGSNVKVIPARLFQTWWNNGESANLVELLFEEGSKCELINSNAFSNCSIKKVELPTTITSVSWDAFAACPIEYAIVSANAILSVKNDNLKTLILTSGESIENAILSGYSNLEIIILPNELKTIGENAFLDCSNLKSITIPENVISIGRQAFYNCISLEEINFNAINMNDLEIDNYTFANAGKNTEGISVNIGENVTRIPAYLFNVHHYYTDSLPYITNVNFEENSKLEMIGVHSFRNASYLTNIVIPESVVEIGDYSFYGCSNLLSISIPSVKELKNYVFANCSSLQYIILSQNLESIGVNTFYNCLNLKEINFSETLLSIGENAFSGCESIEEISLGKNISYLGSEAFSNCPNLSKIKYNILQIDEASNVFENSGSNTGGIDVLFGENVEKIPAYLFSECTFLKRITMAENCVASTIGEYAFSDCSNLEEISLSKNLTTISPYAFARCPALKYIYYNAKNLEDLNFSSEVFYNSGVEIEVVIGNCVERIPAYLFNNVSIVSVEFEEGSVCENIGEYSFKDTKIKNIELPQNLKQIDNFAFGYCYYLEEINFNACCMNDLSSSVFSGAGEQSPGLKINIGTEVTKIPSNIFSWSNVTEVNFSESNNCISVGEYAFGYCKIKEIIIPENLINIDESSFKGCPIEVAIIPNYAAKAINNSNLINVVVTSGEIIEANSFLDCDNLKNISLPETIKRIESNAFAGCSSLTEITISSEIEFIGNGAFSNCLGIKIVNYNSTKLQDLDVNSAIFANAGVDGFVVNFGKNVQNIPAYLFYNNNQYSYVNKIIFEEECNLLNIGEYAFSKNNLLEEVNLPISTTNIGASAFSGCENLRSLTIPENVEQIGANAFGSSVSLEEVNFNAINMQDLSSEDCIFSGAGQSGLVFNIGAKVKHIPNYLFSNNYSSSNVKTINLGENSSLETIGDYAFYNSKMLYNVTLPESVVSIGVSSFAGCSINGLVLPKDIKSIGASAFSGCSNIREIILNDEIEYIGDCAFEGCQIENATTPIIFINRIKSHYLKEIIITSGEVLDENAFYNYTNLEKVYLPQTLKTIEANAFYNCTSLRTITIPENVTNIGTYAFYNCTSLEEINFDAINMNDLVVDNYTFANAGKNTEGISVNIGENVTRIPAYLFNVHHYYTDSLPHITNVNFEENSKLEMIGVHSFRNASYLTNIVIPESVVEIGDYSFYGCSNLLNVSFNNNLNKLGEYAFAYCTSLLSVNLENQLEEIELYAFSNCTSLTSVVIPATVKDIDSHAFSNCTGLVNVEFNYGLININNNAFENCSSLSHISIPESVKTIENSAFAGCSSLEEIVVPFVGLSETEEQYSNFSYIFGAYGYNSIGYVPTSLKKVTVTRGKIATNAFYHCDSIETIILEDEVTSIGAWAFSDCTNLKEVVMSNNITTIGGVAFSSCKSLTSIIIPESVIEIGNSLFSLCNSLSKIFVYSDVVVQGIENILNDSIETVVIKKYDDFENNYLIQNYPHQEEISQKYISYSKHKHNWNEKETLIEKINCVQDGLILCECLECGLENEVLILKHNESDWIVDVDATCEENGIKHTECINCKEIIKEDIVNAIGHSYGSVEYSWSADYSQNTATRVCLNDNSHIETETVVSTATILYSPTCEETGNIKYVAYFTNTNFEQQEIENVLPALGHSYEITYSWSVYEEYAKVEAKAYCANDINHCVVESTFAEFEVINNPTCTEVGLGIYTGTFNEEIFTIQTHEYVIDALGHSLKYYDSLAPTCEQDGYEAYEECDRCDHTTYQVIQALGHNYGKPTVEWNFSLETVKVTHVCANDRNHKETETVTAFYYVITEPTCTSKGLGRYISDNFVNPAFEVQTYDVDLAELGHELIYHDYLAPTCEENGHEAYEECSRCDYTTYLEISALGHDSLPEVEENRIEPTCENPGSYEIASYCSVCDKELSRDFYIIDALGHNYESTITNPTCLEQGYTTHVCQVCDDTYVDSYIAALGHNYSSVEYVWNNDYTNLTATHTCLNDNSHIETETVSTTYTVINEPTCLNEGLGRYVSNSFTNLAFIVQSKDITIDALGHELTQYEYKAPTCTEIGHEAYEECSRCDYTTYVEIGAVGHMYNSVSYVHNDDYTKLTATRVCSLDPTHIESETVDVLVNVITLPTCETDGLNEYVPQEFSIDGFTSSILYRPVPALGHNYKEVNRVNPTCETDGFVEYVCDNDKTHTYKEELTALGHTYEAVVTEPTCLAGGYTTHTCSVCNDSYQDTYVEALGHNIVKYDYLAPTCEENGHEAYEECSRCDYTTYIEISALGHTYEAVVTNPTCLDGGYTTHTCSRCDDSYQDSYVEALGHDLTHYEYKAPACEEDGHNAYDECSRCDYSTYMRIAAVGHKYNPVLKKPTCEEQGYTTFTCLNCYDYYIDNYEEPLGHDYVISEKVDATCETDGYVIYVCSRNEAHSYKEEIKALGHNIVKYDYLAPTCEKEGHETYEECTNCDYSTFIAILAYGHNYEHVKTVEPTCTTSGYMTFVCTNDPSHTYDKDLNPKGHTYGHYMCDETHHWKSCECGDEIKGEHEFSDWEITKEPTTSAEGLTERYCKECGYKESDTIPMIKKGCFGGFEQSMIAIISLSCITLYISKKRRKENE